MITITNLSINFDQRILLDKVSFSIFPKERIGLAGPNGAGKTTLFSIVLGDREPSGGDVQRQKNLHVGYLPQEAHFSSTRTVLEEVSSGDRRISKLLKEKRSLEDAGKAGEMRYGDVLHELEQLGIYDLEHRAEKILSGLGFKEEDFNRPINHLSGGWQMRTLLAKLLVYPYDLLLLDEPTNYLDLSAIIWLKDYLSNYPGAFVLISHDKLFLNDVTNYTMILDRGKLIKVKGNYEAYEQQKGVELKTLEKRKKVVDKKRAQLERFAQRFHGQPNRASAVRNKRKVIEKLENIDLPQESRSIKEFQFPETRESGYVVASLDQVSKSYGEKQVYQNLDFEITKGQKVCFVGPNGAGKSTLLKMLAQIIPADSGKRKLGHQVDMGYFSQTRLDVLNPNRTAAEEVASAAVGGVPALKVRSLLGLFNFVGDDVFKKVQVLSGGEKSRLILAKLLINPPNFLLLDEPTTHLDIDGVEALTRAFKEYKGSLCMISHDLYFIKEIANCIVEVNQGQVKTYSGGLQYYLDKKGIGWALHAGKGSLEKISTTIDYSLDVVQERKQQKKKEKDEKKRKKARESEKVKALHGKHKEALKKIKDMKTEIKDLEQEKKDLETESYIKARVVGESFSNRDKALLKEFGQRLKYIPKRMREIDNMIDGLQQKIKQGKK